MDFRSLEVLIWLVKDPNLKRTAERLKLSQPTLTKRLAQLEEEIGQQLFERRGSLGLAPTPHTLELAASAKTLLDNWSYATNLVKMKSSKKPYLSLNGPSLFMQTVIAPLWAKSNLHSQYLLHIRTSPVVDITFEVSGDDLDAAFLFDKNMAMDFKFMPVCTEQMAIIYNAKAGISPEDMLRKKVDGMQWLSYRPDRDPLTLLIQAEVLPKKNIVGFFEDLPTLLNVICSDARFATVLPMHSILHNPQQLRGLAIADTEKTLYFVYRPEGERQQVFKEFGEFVVKELDQHPLFAATKMS